MTVLLLFFPSRASRRAEEIVLAESLNKSDPAAAEGLLKATTRS